MIALWAEVDLVVADQFHDGNVPAHQEPLSCCQMAFEALPETVGERYFRGDSACSELYLLDWFSAAQREQEPGGRIGFAVSAVMSPQLAQTITVASAWKWRRTSATSPRSSVRVAARAAIRSAVRRLYASSSGTSTPSMPAAATMAIASPLMPTRPLEAGAPPRAAPRTAVPAGDRPHFRGDRSLHRGTGCRGLHPRIRPAPLAAEPRI